MSFEATADDLRQLAAFLDGMRELSMQTGVKIHHYDRVQLMLPSGAELSIDTRPSTADESTEYYVSERDAS